MGSCILGVDTIPGDLEMDDLRDVARFKWPLLNGDQLAAPMPNSAMHHNLHLRPDLRARTDIRHTYLPIQWRASPGKVVFSPITLVAPRQPI